MFTKFNILFVLISLLITSTHAQLLVPRNATRADSLRGMLTPLRTCYDVKYYHLDINVDPSAQTVSGSNTMFFAVEQPFERFQIDLFSNMNIEKIIYKGQQLKFSREYNAIFVDFPEQLKPSSIDSITVFYNGTPIVAHNAPWDGGFVWKKDKAGNPWVGVACQGLGASLWWPNKDHLSDEPDSMMISVTVPKGLINVSNGRLRRQVEVSPASTRFDWFVSYPINNYNVTVNIAQYKHWNDIHINQKDTLTLDYYVLSENVEKSKKHFLQVKPMLKCYEKYLGKYPFYRDGFKLIETEYLGMEHQSAIAYGNKYLPGYLGKDYSRISMDFDYIIFHEAGHEWWGNNVGCSDIADMWINEGFCTYTESFYVEDILGPQKAKEYINSRRTTVGNKEPVMGVYGLNKEGNKDMYDKGALILHTLRYVINNDTLWFDIIKGIQKEFALKTISEQDIVQYINRRTNKDFNYFFDQYLKYPKIPVLEIKHTMKGRKSILSYRWKADVKDFRMPVKVSVKNQNNLDYITPTTEWQEIAIKVAKEQFKVATDLFYIDLSDLTNIVSQ